MAANYSTYDTFSIELELRFKVRCGRKAVLTVTSKLESNTKGDNVM